MKTAIIGGGVLGLTVALRRAQAGDDVTIFERSPEVGGLAASFVVAERDGQPVYLEKFYHHIFGTDKDIVRVIGELGLADDLLWLSTVTATLRGGRAHRLDSPLSVLRFPPMPLPARVRMAAALAYLKFESNYQRLEGQTAAQWIPRWMGRSAYENVWEPLLRGKFGDRANDIALTWYWSRVHERTQRLGYLRGGFQRLYQALERSVRELGGDLRLGVSVTHLSSEPDGRVLVDVDGRAERFDAVVVTTPTRIFTQMARDSLPADYIERFAGAGAIEHFGAQCLILSLKEPLLDQTYWLNLNDPGFPFLAVIEHTNALPPEDYDGQHLIYLPNYLPVDDPLFAMTADELLARFLPALQQLKPSFTADWIQRRWLFRAPFAQPIMTVDYPSKLPPHETPLAHVYLANMAHVYPQDRGQNYSIRLGEQMARMLAEREAPRIAAVSAAAETARPAGDPTADPA